MAPVEFDVTSLAAILPPGGMTLVSGCSAESAVLADSIEQAGEALGAMTFSGIFVAGLNHRTWLPNAASRMLTFFMTPELRASRAAVDFLPLCYSDILSLLRARRPAAALFMVSPPDQDGYCSFGTQVDFIADLWRDIPVRIAHINPLMPATPGHRGIPFSEITAWTSSEQPLLKSADDPHDAVSSAIGRHVAAYIPDGATLQTGLGKIPGAVLRTLVNHRNLRLHSGLVGDPILDLIAAGAMAPGASATVGVAIGSERLYSELSNPVFNFQPVTVSHDPRALGSYRKLVTINSAIEVDLFGQVYAELTPRGFMSGPGGASDFARGARLADGLRIVALPSDAARGRVSRIVPPGEGAGPVSLSRMDVDLIVTEHGSADLRELTYQDRAAALIAIAAPEHREALSSAWDGYRQRL